MLNRKFATLKPPIPEIGDKVSIQLTNEDYIQEINSVLVRGWVKIIDPDDAPTDCDYLRVAGEVLTAIRCDREEADGIICHDGYLFEVSALCRHERHNILDRTIRLFRQRAWASEQYRERDRAAQRVQQIRQRRAQGALVFNHWGSVTAGSTTVTKYYYTAGTNTAATC